MAKKAQEITWGSFFWGIPAFLWQALFFYVPLSVLLATSFVKYFSETESLHFTSEYYRAIFDAAYIPIFLRSLFLACTTVVVCLLIAYPVSYYLALKVRKWKTLCFALLILPFWTNFLLLVYAWYFLLENDGLVNWALMHLGIISQPLHLMNTSVAVYCGMFYCYLPFMILPLYSTFERLDKRLLEASKDLGATDWQTLVRITIPLTLPGIKTGALLVFIPAFGEFVVPALLGGDKNMYIGSVITHYFLTIRNVSLGSAFTCLASGILVLLLLCVVGLYSIVKNRRNNA